LLKQKHTYKKQKLKTLTYLERLTVRWDHLQSEVWTGQGS